MNVQTKIARKKITLKGLMQLFLWVMSFFVLILFSCNGHKTDVDEHTFYTCSMDPQIMEKKAGRCPVCNMELTRIVITGREKMDEIRLSDEQIRLGGIQTDTASYRLLGSGKVFLGLVRENENTRSVISAFVSGRLEKLYVNAEGGLVKEGEKMYELFSNQLNETQRDLLYASGAGKEFSQAAKMATAARNKLKLWGMTEVQLNEITGNEKVLSPVPYYSPVRGIITKVMVQEGQEVMEGDELYEVSDLSQVWVEARVFGSDMYRVREGDQVQVAFPDISSELTSAKITFASPEPGEGSKISIIRAAVSNSDGLLIPGMAARISFEAGKKKVLSLPSSAVIRDTQGAHVWISKGKGTYLLRRVSAGIQGSDFTEIAEGIAPGEEVVTEGTYLLNSEYILRKANSPVR